MGLQEAEIALGQDGLLERHVEDWAQKKADPEAP
jgi:hypothetical protein